MNITDKDRDIASQIRLADDHATSTELLATYREQCTAELRAENEALTTCVAKKDEALKSAVVHRHKINVYPGGHAFDLGFFSPEELERYKEALALTSTAAVDQIAQLKAQLEKAEAELAEARKDKERLDWLERKGYSLTQHTEIWEYHESTTWWQVTKGKKSLSGHPLACPRAAIDAAMPLPPAPAKEGAK